MKPISVLHIISGDLWAGAEVQAYTLLKHLRSYTELYVVLLNEGELADRLRALGVKVTVLPESELSALSLLKHLVALIKELAPDVIHTHRQKENILGCLANVLAFPSSANRPKSIRTTHGAPEFKVSGKQRLQVWLDSFVGKYLQQAVVAVSDDLAKKLLIHFPVKHIKVVHNGVDSGSLLASATVVDFKLRAPEYRHIGIIGRLESVKRIDIFLDAAALLLQDLARTMPLRFHIIGDGSLKSSMQKKAEDLGISEHVVFHGHRVDIASCIYSLDAIVMCSDHEGTPMTALECLALGKPLVAHDVGGLHELFADQSELLVAEHNPQAYVSVLKKVLTQSAPKTTLPRHYTAEANSEAMLNLYKNLLHK